ncbi:lysis protein [Arsenophonus endosymbiont of Aleurodicus floccissimus]|uniref:lysis protein n=1 Tax=Arsenophonus endosymbiont of Aleurodicus floccissimus TaxID=2152761 RepID=UPI001EE0CCFA|nr:lysis protein [Arsenophonus endosymbiont of Aleurodicus floccissimus]
MERANDSSRNRERNMLWRPYAFVVVIIVGLMLSFVFINAHYQTVKQNYQTLKQQYHAQLEAAKLKQQKIDALYHQLDIQHPEELSDAKAKITKLNDAVRASTISGFASTPFVRHPKPLLHRADMMKSPQDLAKQLEKIISVYER